MTRVLAFDLGQRRIGVAVSDPERRVAVPVTVVQRINDKKALHRQLADLVDEYEAQLVVVGLPISLNGSEGDAAKGVLAEVEQLRTVVKPQIQLIDERFTTVVATQALSNAKVSSRQRRRVVDASAATVMLQDWLDRRSNEQEL